MSIFECSKSAAVVCVTDYEQARHGDADAVYCTSSCSLPIGAPMLKRQAQAVKCHNCGATGRQYTACSYCGGEL